MRLRYNRHTLDLDVDSETIGPSEPTDHAATPQKRSSTGSQSPSKRRKPNPPQSNPDVSPDGPSFPGPFTLSAQMRDRHVSMVSLDPPSPVSGPALQPPGPQVDVDCFSKPADRTPRSATARADIPFPIATMASPQKFAPLAGSTSTTAGMPFPPLKSDSKADPTGNCPPGWFAPNAATGHKPLPMRWWSSTDDPRPPIMPSRIPTALGLSRRTTSDDSNVHMNIRITSGELDMMLNSDMRNVSGIGSRLSSLQDLANACAHLTPEAPRQ